MGTLSTGQRLCQGCWFSVVSISMCLLILAFLISMQASRSVLCELDFYQKWLCSARLEGLDDPCMDSLLDGVMGN